MLCREEELIGMGVPLNVRHSMKPLRHLGGSSRTELAKAALIDQGIPPDVVAVVSLPVLRALRHINPASSL